MNKRTLTRIAGTASVAVCLGIAMGVPADASTAAHSGHGTCSAASTVKLTASNKKQMIKVEAKLNAGMAIDAWDWTLSDNGTPVASDEATPGRNHKVVVRQSIPNLDGTDTVAFSATDTVTGETCTAQLAVK